MKPEDKIEKLIGKLQDRTSTELDERTLKDVFSVLEKSTKTQPALKQPNIWRIIKRRPIAKFAAVAVIIIAILIGISQFGDSVDLTTVAWGQIQETMKELPYIHIITKTYSKGNESISQSWINFNEKKVFSIYPGDHLWCWDHNKEREYFYSPNTKKLTICYMREGEASKIDSAYGLIDTIIDKMKKEEAAVSYKKSKLNGEDVIIAEISKKYPDGNMSFNNTVVKQQNFKLIVNQKTNLITEGQLDHLDLNDAVISHAELKINYPQKGPKNIYDIGVPKEASIFYSTKTVIHIEKELVGPATHVFPDGSIVRLEKGAKVGLYRFYDREQVGRRGLEHIAGEIEVNVAEGKGEFVVATSFGVVKALGTIFKMDLITINSTEVLTVKVKEGSIEVSNPQGSSVIKTNQGVTVERDKAPYDFTQDKNLPPRLIERIQSMLEAMEAGDGKAWIANFNIKALYDLAKGNIKFSDHRDWFSGMSEQNAEDFVQAFSDVKSQEEIYEIFGSDVNLRGPRNIYIGSVTLADDGKHATARCVRERGEKQYTIYTPQWTYFDGDWWQTDD